MAESAHRKVGGGLVEVRLSEVPVDLRRHVADLIINKGRLSNQTSPTALELTFYAAIPRQNPSIWVTREKAARVLGGRLPTGTMPKVWEW